MLFPLAHKACVVGDADEDDDERKWEGWEDK